LEPWTSALVMVMLAAMSVSNPALGVALVL
jgi:hypothetical protein